MATTLRYIPEQAIFASLDALTAKLTPKANREFLKALQAALASTDRNKVVLALAYGDVSLVDDAVPWLKVEIDLAEYFVGPAFSAVAKAAGVVGAWLAVSELNLEAVTEALNARAALRAKEITDSTRDGMRALVQRGYVEGRPIGEVQSDVESVLFADGGYGLDRRSSEAIARRLARMARDENLTAKERAALLKKLQRQALARRADMIVRTEMNALINETMLAQWRAAGVTHKEWVARMDGKTCERCAAFDGIVVPIESSFVSRRGEVAFMPEIHPNGYCVMRPGAV